MKKIIKKLNNQRSGQGVIEAIVSLAIITTALVGSVSLATYTIKSGTENREKVVATNLVQEGMEIARNIRDTYWVNTSDPATAWTSFYNSVVNSSRGVSYDGSKWIFSGSSSTETINGATYTRVINFSTTNPVDVNKIKVSCSVSWVGGGPIIAHDILTNWKQTEKP